MKHTWMFSLGEGRSQRKEPWHLSALLSERKLPLQPFALTKKFSSSSYVPCAFHAAAPLLVLRESKFFSKRWQVGNKFARFIKYIWISYKKQAISLYTYILNTAWVILILIQYPLFIWNLNLTECPVFYLATLIRKDFIIKPSYFHCLFHINPSSGPDVFTP